MQEKRNVNIELIRIVAMLAVIIHHYFRHGGGTVWPEFGTVKYTVFWAADAFAFVCVNLFVLISGYCLAQTKFKISRLIRLWVETETYSIICVVVCKILGADISSIQVIKALMPFTTESYWFVTAYALLLCFAPFLNIAINNMNQKQHRLLIALVVIVFSIMPTFFVWERDLITTGMDYEWFVALYIIASYIRKYGLKCNVRFALVGYVIFSFVTGLARIPLGVVSYRIVGSYILSGLFFRYNSITVLVASVFLFWALLNTDIKNKMIQKAISNYAPLTFAVYLIHDNEFVRNILWSTLPMRKLYESGVVAYSLGLIIFVPLIYFACCAIEIIRVYIMRKLNYKNVLEKSDEIYDKSLS